MENQNFKCSGNCLNCIPAQRAYCASQHAYSNMRVLDTMMNELVAMKGDIKVMSEKIDAIQNNEASVFDPNDVSPSMVHTPIAQKGDGAEE